MQWKYWWNGLNWFGKILLVVPFSVLTAVEGLIWLAEKKVVKK
jgi:hypothetical protein